MMTTAQMVLLAFAVGFVVGLLWLVVMLCRHDARTKRVERDLQLQAELDGLRAAHRLNVAYWQTKQQMNRAAGRPPRRAVRR